MELRQIKDLSRRERGRREINRRFSQGRKAAPAGRGHLFQWDTEVMVQCEILRNRNVALH